MTGGTASTILRLGTASWHGDVEQDFPLPAGWVADVLPPRDAPALSPDDIVTAVRTPMGMPPIAQAASGCQDAVLLIDDLARPTPGELICMAVMDELNRAGIADDRITILIATGAHRPLEPHEMALKVGQAMARARRTVSHDAYAPEVAFVGLTSTAPTDRAPDRTGVDGGAGFPLFARLWPDVFPSPERVVLREQLARSDVETGAALSTGKGVGAAGRSAADP